MRAARRSCTRPGSGHRRAHCAACPRRRSCRGGRAQPGACSAAAAPLQPRERHRARARPTRPTASAATVSRGRKRSVFDHHAAAWPTARPDRLLSRACGCSWWRWELARESVTVAPPTHGFCGGRRAPTYALFVRSAPRASAHLAPIFSKRQLHRLLHDLTIDPQMPRGLGIEQWAAINAAMSLLVDPARWPRSRPGWSSAPGTTSARHRGKRSAGRRYGHSRSRDRRRRM